ncbi:Retrovirus-related Pol polyprotein from transposon TNT 1-94 [Sesbania bispinosa]|nr:Retrovirus-related Pol polyprotein from transposon TNT 1-94 [Sesbania bispinosa]
MKVVAIVRSEEESRRGLMLESPAVENSAMVADHKGDQTLAMVAEQKKGGSTNGRRKVMVSGVPTAISLVITREKCWKLYGKPFKSRSRRGDTEEAPQGKEDKDVTFNEQEGYFHQPYLQGESFREDKESSNSGFPILPDLTDLIFEPKLDQIEAVTSETSQGSEAGQGIGQEKEAGQKSEINCEADQGDVEAGKFGKKLVYSRKTKAIPGSSHVQESNSTPQKEVTIFSPVVQVEIETQNDLDLPIAIRKGTRKCTKQPLYLPSLKLPVL